MTTASSQAREGQKLFFTWQGEGGCQSWHCTKSPGRAHPLLFLQQPPACLSLNLSRIAVAILSAPVLASTVLAPVTHPRASPVCLAVPKKGLPLSLPRFPFLSFVAQGRDSRVVAGTYTKDVGIGPGWVLLKVLAVTLAAQAQGDQVDCLCCAPGLLWTSAAGEKEHGGSRSVAQPRASLADSRNLQPSQKLIWRTLTPSSAALAPRRSWSQM